MRALVADPSSPHHVSHADVPEPKPESTQAVVEVHAFSINRGEIRGLANRTAGSIPGWDLAGVVVRQASSGGPPEGARVVGYVLGGSWAERVAVPTSQLAELPEAVSFEVASALPVAGLTAVRALEVAGPLFGRRVVVTGAAGGVGHFAVQLAKLSGANVTGVSRTPERAAFVHRLGADEVLSELVPDGDQFDIVLESVGGPSLSAAFSRLATGGIIVSFGSTSGQPASFDAFEFRRKGPARLYALRVSDELNRNQSSSRDLRLLVDAVAAKRLTVEISTTADWLDPKGVLVAVGEGRIVGKAVLTLHS